ncbi:putative metallopeptidase [Bacillus glycinifermentans]|uniref:Metallopeptidase n=1 Tax=Bacillus glycinifermentans TaxID=1664069 RepID=A0A0T6BUX3_9BACI|nr:putative metallopeptidase [Bacillus glycinifermentans]KRT95447.1 hypothetical protein AB447_209615 [Bacillus glycinifermentans]MEC0483545.1 putative metallopeptidase [Bacillus glycinifermentans]MEC3609443.1 putative metallopeptidase [Bacillus glycinifermentans]UOY89169.1 hypothetical protein MW696_02665 [Bacillus glycinifermentans]
MTLYGAVTDPASCREHDVKEFSEIIERHGLWDTGIETFAEAVRETDHQWPFRTTAFIEGEINGGSQKL